MQDRSRSQFCGTIRLPLLVYQQRKVDSGLLAEASRVLQIPQTNSSELRSSGCKFLLMFAQLRDMLAAEYSAIVAEKNNDCGSIGPQRAQAKLITFRIG